jgi:hypothetical protein
VRVVGAGGAAWRVRRRWLTVRRPRWRSRDSDGVDAASDGFDFLDLGDDPISLVIGIVLGLVAVLLLGVFLLPALLFLGELLLLVPLALAGLIGRLLLRRPWTIEASRPGLSIRTHVGGWSASRAEVQRLAAQVRAGELS